MTTQLKTGLSSEKMKVKKKDIFRKARIVFVPADKTKGV